MGIRVSGSFKKTEAWLSNLKGTNLYSDFDSYGKQGVDALSKATPVDSGLTAANWGYNVTKTRGKARIEWYNTNQVNGTSVAILLQYGHGTGTGGYVAGYDYINPAIRPIFDKIANDFWKKVNNG